MIQRNVSSTTKEIVANRQHNRCAACRQFLETTRQIDHIDPLWHGGSNNISNLQALCPNCHARKTRIESKCIPVLINGHRKSCPLCNSIFSPYFLHRCLLFCIVHPGLFSLYRNNRGEQVIFDTGAFVFDNLN